MKVLTLAVARGGTGKTTLAINLAARLASRARRVALLDLDPQASTTLGLGYEPAAEPLAEPAFAVEDEGFTLFAGGRELSLADAAAIRRRIAQAAASCDLLVVDTPPALGAPSLEGMRAASLVLVPIEPSQLSLPGLADMATVLGTWGAAARLRVVLSRVRAVRRLTRDVAEYVADEYPGALCPVAVPEDVRAAESLPLRGASSAARALDQLGDYLLGQLEAS